MKKKPVFLFGVVVSIVFAICLALKAAYFSFPWGDEVGSVDTAVNLTLYGEWVSYNWPYSYQPLHLLLLTPWLKIFGISHNSVCDFNILWAFLASISLLKILDRYHLLESFAIVWLFNLLFWCLEWNCWIFCCGRIDPIVMFFTIGVVDALIDEARGNLVNRTLLAVNVFFLVLAGIYTLPLLAILGFALLFFPGNLTRREVIMRGLVSFCALVASQFVVIVYYFMHKGLLRYLHSTFAHATGVYGGSSPLAALISDKECLCLLILSVMMIVLTNKKWKSIKWWLIALISTSPALLALSGRYMCYYGWVLCVPVSILFIYSLRNCRMFVLVVVTVITSSSILMLRCYRLKTAYGRRNNVEDVRRQFKDVVNNLQICDKGAHMVVPSCLLYYDALDMGFRAWERDIRAEQLLYQDLKKR